jgi:pimeloyl-ACP methyl ester carboxylesterase
LRARAEQLDFGGERGTQTLDFGIMSAAVRGYSESFQEDLKKITVPTLLMHGDDDQIVPYADSGPLSAKLVKNGTLKTYKCFPHGMPTTEAATINADLLTFIKG